MKRFARLYGFGYGIDTAPMKIISLAIALLIVWFGVPHIKRGVWIAPNPLPWQSWTLQYDASDATQALASMPQGYGWRHYDFWNNPPLTGEPVQKGDFKLRW